MIQTRTRFFISTTGKTRTWPTLANATPDGMNNDWLKLDSPKTYVGLYN